MLDGRIVEKRSLTSANGASHFPQWTSEEERQQGQWPTERPTISHIQDESMEKGGIRLSTYRTYIAASCVIYVIF